MRAVLLLALALLLAPGTVRAQASDPLVQAYALESSALQAELTSLQGELARADGALASEEAALREEVGALRARLTALGLEADREERHLETLRVEQGGGASQQELLLVTLDQAAASLERAGRPIAGAQDMADGALLDATLAGGAAVLAEASAVRVEDGSFFLPDGRETAGRILHLGRVAAFGLGVGVAGPLVPAGGGALKLERDEHGQLRDWLAGRRGLLEAYLLDPGSRAQQARASLGVWEHVRSGGALVWPILGLGLLAALLAAERAWTLRRLHSRTDRLLAEVLGHVARGMLQPATEACEREAGAPSRVLLAGLSHWHLPKDQLEDVLKEAIVRELPRLERALPIIAVVAAVAPLLGLLGTVTGMIATFEVITEHGTGDPRMLSGGISVALVTTELGLIVAIPALLVHNLLGTLADHLANDMYKAALVLSNALYKQESFRLDDGRWVARTYEARDEPTGEIAFHREGPRAVPPPPAEDGPPPPPPLLPWPYRPGSGEGAG